MSVLNVYGVTESDFGTYICHAVNSQGDKGFDVQLRKPGISNFIVGIDDAILLTLNM